MLWLGRSRGGKPTIFWGVLVGILVAGGSGCAGRLFQPASEESIFGPGVLKLSEAHQSEGRPGEPICWEWTEPIKIPYNSGSNSPPNGQLYYVLTPRQCQALAAAHAVWGNILDEESELLVPLVGRGRTLRARSAALQSDLLRYAALGERNRAAADALELFYRLAEAEAHWDLCQAALQLMDNVQEQPLPTPSSAVWESGSPSAEKQNKDAPSDRPPNPSAFAESWQAERQRWQKRQEDLVQEIEYLNSQLRPMLGAELGECRRIWPSVSLQVKPEKLDVEKAVQQGLDQRAELRALRRLLRGIDANDLTAVRHALEQWHPALGATPSRFPAIAQWLGTAPQHMEAATRQQQIRFLLARREKEVEEQIRQKAQQVQIALAELAQAQQAYQAAVQASGQKTRAGPALIPTHSNQAQTPSQRASQLAIYEAQAALLSRVVAWKIAEVRLWEAMGILARQTGYPLPEDAWQPWELAPISVR